MKRKRGKSPYLTGHRLADVLAAIQCLGTYKQYKRDFASWSDRICGDKAKADHWKAVFEQHPEFFRIDSTKTKVSLVWRRQYPKRYDVKLGRVLTTEEYAALSSDETRPLSRVALGSDDIQALLRTAIDLHARALEHERERRWWLPMATAGAALIGSLAGSAF